MRLRCVIVYRVLQPISELPVSDRLPPYFPLRSRSIQSGSPQYAASEIAADEIGAKNWPAMQRADILNRRLAFRRHQFTPTRK